MSFSRHAPDAARLASLLAASSMLAVAGCSDIFGSDDERERVTLSFMVPRASTAVATLGAVGGTLADVTVTEGGHTLVLQNAEVVFSRVDLERVEPGEDEDSDRDSEHDTDSDSDGDDAEKFRGGPSTVLLPLEGGLVTLLDAPIPVGRYEEMKARVQRVRVRGLYDTQAFDVTIPLNAKVTAEFDPPFEVDSDSDDLNVTLVIDPRGWFRAANGSLIDPRTVTGNGNITARVKNQIRRSFKAFEDSDKDGDESDTDSDTDE